MNPRELPVERLATSDSQGNRIYLYPADAYGPWQTRRNWLKGILVLFFLTLPWLQIRGQQALLLDFPNRKFAVFGLTFWAHDAPLLLFIFGGAAILLAFVTAIWGRVWCGWACPQTIFVDGVFRKIERWIEGDAFTRRTLDQSPLSWNKIIKKSTKWLLFTALALLISHSFLAYFTGTEQLSKMIQRSPLESPGSFLIMTGTTLWVLFDFGWFREQFCTLVCPYGRFQSVLMDQQTQTVVYDERRGEPRKGTIQPKANPGDCVNCYRCVQVCPTGIDIRRGVQLECIACTACIDACNEVMTRLKKPKDLIRYGLIANTFNPDLCKKGWTLHPRVLLYFGLLVIFVVGLVLQISNRHPIEITWIRATDVPYQTLTGAQRQTEIINHFKVELRNQTFENHIVSFKASASQREKSIQLITSIPSLTIKAGQSERLDIFIRFPKSILTSGRATLIIEGESESIPHQLLSQEVRLIGPF